MGFHHIMGLKPAGAALGALAPPPIMVAIIMLWSIASADGPGIVVLVSGVAVAMVVDALQCCWACCLQLAGV